MNYFLFILFGAPGCGKGTLAQFFLNFLLEQGIVSKADIAYISTGDLLREEISSGSPLGQEISQIVTSGQLVSDKIVNTLIQKALSGSERIKIIDGFPRKASQLESLKEMLLSHPHGVIAIRRNTPTHLIRERVSKRRVCKDCKATHSIDDGCCPKCGGESTIRKDDANIDERLFVYFDNTAPLWDEFKKFATLSISVSGTKDAKIEAEEVFYELYAHKFL